MYIISPVGLFFQFSFLRLATCTCLSLKNSSDIAFGLNKSNNLLFVNFKNNTFDTNNSNLLENSKSKSIPNNRKNQVKLAETQVENIDDDVTKILYGLENPQELRGPYINKEGKIINKKKSLYSTGHLCHVDDFFEGKFKVEWTVRGVKEKLLYRSRDCHTLPLSTSRFTFAGIKGFILRLWLDGHHGSKEGHIAMSLVQQEHWSCLGSPICLFSGNIVRGPFFYRSPEYFSAAKSLCRLEEVLEDNSLRLGVMIAKRDDNPSP